MNNLEFCDHDDTVSDWSDASDLSESSPIEQRHIHSFSMRYRHSGLSALQRATWSRLWPTIGFDILGDPNCKLPVDISTWFDCDQETILEIGCGAGTSTLAMAQQEPHFNVIAVEVYQRGIAQLLSNIDRYQVNNIRIIRGDAYTVLQRYITAESLRGVRVFFPDPWPKKRHHKRRFLQEKTLDLIVEKLAPQGVLHIATDHANYADHIAQLCTQQPQLHPVAITSDLPILVSRPTTKYEAKGHDAGRSIADMIWEKY